MPKNDTNDVRDPVVDVGATVKAGLDEFDGAAVYACADEDRWEPEAARIGEREGECGEAPPGARASRRSVSHVKFLFIHVCPTPSIRALLADGG